MREGRGADRLNFYLIVASSCQSRVSRAAILHPLGRVRTALTNLVPFGFHTGFVRPVERVTSLLILSPGLLDVLLILVL